MVAAFVATAGLACLRPALGGDLASRAAEGREGGAAGVWNAAEDLGYVVGPLAGGLLARAAGDLSTPFLIVGLALLGLALAAAAGWRCGARALA